MRYFVPAETRPLPLIQQPPGNSWTGKPVGYPPNVRCPYVVHSWVSADCHAHGCTIIHWKIAPEDWFSWHTEWKSRPLIVRMHHNWNKSCRTPLGKLSLR